MIRVVPVVEYDQIIAGMLDRIRARLGDDGRDVAGAISSGHLTCWLVHLDDAPAGVVCLERYVGDSAGIALCAGDRFEEWEEPIVRLCFQWAKDNGAAHLEVRGRKGWARSLARYGFQWAGDCLTARV